MVDTRYKEVVELINLLKRDQDDKRDTLHGIEQQISNLTINMQLMIKRQREGEGKGEGSR